MRLQCEPLWETAHEFWEITSHNKVGSLPVVKMRGWENTRSEGKKGDSVTANCCCRPSAKIRSNSTLLPPWNRRSLSWLLIGDPERNYKLHIAKWHHAIYFQYGLRAELKYFQTNQRFSGPGQMHPITSSCCPERIFLLPVPYKIPPREHNFFLWDGFKCNAIQPKSKQKGDPLFESWAPSVCSAVSARLCIEASCKHGGEMGNISWVNWFGKWSIAFKFMLFIISRKYCKFSTIWTTHLSKMFSSERPRSRNVADFKRDFFHGFFSPRLAWLCT